MKRPKVSVVMPIYNVELYLRECLDSVVSQTLLDIEIIAVNDGSPDSCGEIIDCYAAKDSRIKAIHKKNGGYGSAVNAGIDEASGEYLAIVETDDYIALDMLESLYKQAIESGVDISRGSYFVVENTEVGEVCIPQARNARVFNVSEHPQFMVTPPAIWSSIYKLDFLNYHNVRVIDSLGASYQDVDFFVRTAILAKKIICTYKPYYYYRLDNPGSSSNSLEKTSEIFKNYRRTDLFVESCGDLVTKDTMNFYKKRKVCDFLWHFRRINPVSRYKFSAACRLNMNVVEIYRLKHILTFDQIFFAFCFSFYPALYVFIYNVLKRDY
tara:strand:+ start:8484 stop:9458 length:975 start_codon:yes stop_codon:yes gene_type:complete